MSIPRPPFLIQQLVKGPAMYMPRQDNDTHCTSCQLLLHLFSPNILFLRKFCLLLESRTVFYHGGHYSLHEREEILHVPLN